jgi:hypothetical protein
LGLVRGKLGEGASLGRLWMEGYFEVGDPLTASGGFEERGIS